MGALTREASQQHQHENSDPITELLSQLSGEGWRGGGEGGVVPSSVAS